MQRIDATSPTRRFRSVWISDVHLGFRGSSADFLLQFLRSTECDYLYLVGDIVDVWQMKKRPYWPQLHNDVIRAVLGKAKHGTRVVYVPGNHDEALRAYSGHAFGNVSIQDKALHRRASGERLLVLHGDQFDAVVASSRWLGLLGGWAYDWLLRANTLINGVRRLFGCRYWSLAKFLKHRVKNAMRYISNFEHAVASEAARWDVDGVVCGHIHRPEITEIGELTYYNCGDWVESCTALVEYDDGTMELLAWSDAESLPVPLADAA